MTDLNTQILIEIRDEIVATRTDLAGRIAQTNDRLDQTNERLDQMNERLDQTNERLERTARRQVESEVRLVTELIAVRGAVTDVATLLREDVSLREDVGDLRARVERLESKVH